MSYFQHTKLDLDDAHIKGVGEGFDIGYQRALANVYNFVQSQKNTAHDRETLEADILDFILTLKGESK